VEQQGGDDGDRHADRGDHVAALGGGRVGALFQPEDEEREGHDVERRGGIAARLEDRVDDHLPAPSSLDPSAPGRIPDPPGSPVADAPWEEVDGFAWGFGFFEDMPSIRSVTMKPPTMLIAPKATAIVPIRYSSGSSA